MKLIRTSLACFVSRLLPNVSSRVVNNLAADRKAGRKAAPSLAAIFAGLSLLMLAPYAQAAIVHPGCLSTQADLDRMATKVAAGAQPWKGSWDILVGNEGWYNIGPYPVATVYVDSPNSGSNYMVLANDSHRAYQAALRYHGSGDKKYADHAIEIMNAWASTHTAWDGNSNVFLRMGLYGYAFACAGELLRDYDGWDPADFTAFQQYMRDQFYKGSSWWIGAQNNSHYWANWTLANMDAVLAIGVLCDDQSIIDEALNHFYNGVHTGAIENAVYYVHPNGLGQWQESGRDQGHAQMGPQLIGVFCEIAWNQGYDLYGYMGNRVLAGVEYISKYNMSHAVPFAAYANSDYGVWPYGYRFVFKGVAGWPSGGGRPGWDLIYNHYVNRMGIAAPYTAKYAEATRPEGGGRNYGSNSGGFDGLGFTTLTHSRDPIAGAVPGTLRPVVQGRQITLSWAGSAHATSYNVKRSTTSGGPYTTLATVDGYSLFYVDPGLTAGTTYYYVVSANNPGGESANSAEATATADGQLFGTVIGSDYSSGWHGATREILFDGSLANFIDIGESGGGWAGLDLGSEVSAVITGVKYCPRPSFANAMVGGKFQASNTADFSGDVVDLFTIATAPTEGVLTFQTVNSGSAYRYVRYIQPNNGEWNTAAEVQFLGNASGQSAPSTPVVEGTLVNGLQIDLSLSGLSGIPGTEGYRIKRSTTSGGPYLVYGDINTGYGDTTKFSDVETELNTTYYYVVSAYNQFGESADTAEFSYTTLPTAPQLRTYLKMSGNVADSSRNNFQAGTVGSPEFPGGGYVGPAIDLDGVDDYLALNSRVADSDDITVAAWVNWDGGDAWQRIFDFGAGTGEYLYLTPSSADGIMRFAINNGSEQIVETASALPTGTWTHVAVTLSGDTATIYVNGSPVASSSSITINPSDFDHLSSYIGKSQWATDPLFDGRIDEFRVYNYALSAGDVAALAAEASDMTPPATPAGLGAIVGDETIYLNWSDNGESDFASYTVYRSTTSGSDYSVIATGLTASTYTDNTVSNAVTYYYIVTAVDTSGGESADSAEISTTPQGASFTRYELEGNTLDSSGNGHHATVTGSPTYVTGHQVGQAIDLDGSNDYLSIPSGVISGVDNMTIAAWVNWDGGSDWQRIFDFGDGTNRYLFLSPSAGSEKLRFTINNGKGDQIVEDTEALAIGTWVHVAVTLSNWTTTLYVNGVAVASNDASINPTGFDFTPVNNYIGKSQFGPDPLFNGRIDDFRIYNYALTAAQIKDVVQGSDNLPPAAPIGLSGAAGDSSISLDWADNSEPDLASYTVYRSTTSGSGYVSIASGLANSAYTDHTVSDGVTYHYVVTAMDTAANESANSAEATATIKALELHLKFDETSGTSAADSTGNGWNGTLVNGPTWVAGYNNAVNLSGDSQYVTLPAGVVSNLNDFTISTWVKPTSISSWSRIFDFGTGTNNYMFLTPRGAGRPRFAIRTPGVREQIVDSSIALPTGVWTHVAVTRSGDTVSIYIDGSFAGSGTITLNPSDLGVTTQNYLGKSQFSGDAYLDAALDEFRIYDEAMSAADIALLASPFDAPQNIIATPGNSQISLSWNAVDGADGYTIRRAAARGGPYSELASGISETTYVDSGLADGETWYYTIAARGLLGEGVITDPVSATIKTLGLHLKFDETSGTNAADSTGNGWNGTLVNGPTWVAGYNNAVNLSGDSQYVTLPAGVVSNLNDFTISTWVKPTSISSWSRIFDFGTGTNNYMFLTPQAAGRPRFAIRTPGVGEQFVDSSIALATGVWSHIAVTRSGDTVSIYIDGSFAGSGTITLSPSDLGVTTQNYLGKSQFSEDAYIDAALDEFRIYEQAMSAAEIALLASPFDAPHNITATPGNSQISLSWNAVDGADGYTIRRAAARGGPYSELASGIPETTYVDWGLADGKTWYYTIAVRGLQGERVISNPVYATTFTAIENWRFTNFGTIDNTGEAADGADPDGDSWTNEAEFISGTDPNNFQSALKIIQIQESGSDWIVSFDTILGKTYRLECSNTLAVDSWTTVEDNIKGIGSTVQITDVDGAAQPKRFYRIVLIL